MAPIFPFTEDDLADECAEIDAWKARLDQRVTLPRRWVGQLRRDLETEKIAASTIMEQVQVTVEEVRRILAGAPTPNVSDEDRSLVLGYRQAMGFVLRQADGEALTWERSLVTNLHDRVMGGSFALGAGRIREGQVFIVNADGREVFRPPTSKQVPALLDRVLRRMSTLRCHPALRSAWLHVAVAAVHPFSDGNGRTCRVLASAAMYREGFRLPEFTSLEEWWGRHLTTYYSAFECLSSQFDAAADVTPFLGVHVNAQLSQVRALDLRQRAEGEIWIAIDNLVGELGLPERLTTALWEVFFDREVTAGYYRLVADVSAASATTDLARATAAGLLGATGERRTRRYGPGPRLYPEVLGQLGIEQLSGTTGTARLEIVRALTDRLATRHPEKGRAPGP